MKSKNRGFTLIELIVVIAVMTILLGIAIPSLNSILGFRVNRAANSIASALDKTRTEAMNRLVGEMKLEKEQTDIISAIIWTEARQAGNLMYSRTSRKK